MAGAEAVLLTAWASLHRFHEDLALVGGLAVKYLTKRDLEARRERIQEQMVTIGQALAAY
jgi:hypothetical protein